MDLIKMDSIEKDLIETDLTEKELMNMYRYNRKKELACKQKLKQAMRENPNTYQYAICHLTLKKQC